MAKLLSIPPLLLSLLLTVSLTGCAAQPTALPVASQPVKAAAIPALPPQARQLPVPSWCLPTCSSALTSERAIWQDMLTKATAGE